MFAVSRHALQVIAITGLYLASALLSLLAATENRAMVLLWPPAGLSLGLLILLGRRALPALLLGALAFGLVSAFWHPDSLALGLFAGCAIGVADVAGGLLGAKLTNRYAGGRAALDQAHTVLLFVVFAGVISTALAALISTSALAVAHQIQWDDFIEVLVFRWLASVAGAMLFGPALLVWNTRIDWSFKPQKVAEMGVMLVVLGLLCTLIFTEWIVDLSGTPLAFLILPVPLWAAFRFGQRGTTCIVLLIAAITAACTLSGYGPFALGSYKTSLLLLQNFIIGLTFMAFILSADVSQKKSMDQHLRSSEQRYRALFETNPMPMWVYDCTTLRFLAVNQAAIDHYGYSREEFLAMTIANLRPSEDLNHLKPGPNPAANGHASRHIRRDGTIIEVETIQHNISFDGARAAVVLSNDITRRNLDEKHLAAFSELGKRLSAARTAREAGLILAETADRLFGWDACFLDLRTAGSGELVSILCIDTINGQRLDCDPEPNEPGPITERVLSECSPLLLHDGGGEVNRFGDRSRASACLMFVPIRREGKAMGIFSIQSYVPNAYTQEDLATLQTLVDHCSGALERIRVEADLEGQLAERRKAEQEVLRLNAELERRVRDRTAQLEATNKELEAFAYSVSHDLRAPLRSIRGFSEVLLERYACQIDQRGQEFLRRTCQSSHQMDRLIEDLLKFSRVSRSELHRLPVDLSSLAQSLTDELRKSAPERAIEVNIAPGLQAFGDERLLRIVLDNLLRNAWKFTGKQPQPKIELGRVEDGEPAFFVRDNGAGFDMSYASKMFGVFQRLHTASEFPGTGIGLATVQRIINRHGGRIWAAGEVGRGATFYFTLPEKADR